MATVTKVLALPVSYPTDVYVATLQAVCDDYNNQGYDLIAALELEQENVLVSNVLLVFSKHGV